MNICNHKKNTILDKIMLNNDCILPFLCDRIPTYSMIATTVIALMTATKTSTGKKSSIYKTRTKSSY